MKNFNDNLSSKNIMIIGLIILIIGVSLLFISIASDVLALIIISLVFLIGSVYFFIKADKKNKEEKDTADRSQSKSYISIHREESKSSPYKKFNTIENEEEKGQKSYCFSNYESYDYEIYKGLISNNFDLENITSTFHCSMLIMALNQIKENKYFKPSDLSFNVDYKINQIKELSKQIFLKSVYRSFCAIDVETTGLSSEKDRIIQIAIVKVINGDIVDNYMRYVNPEKHIKQEASEVNNIYDEDVKDAKTIKELFPEILEFIGNLPIVAHNAEFDIGFLRQEYFRSFQTQLPEFKIKCTMKLWRQQYIKLQGKKVPSSKLQTLVINLLSKEEVQEYENGKHDACCDAIATAKVFMKIFGNIKNKKQEGAI